jgi:hypothetical protein
MVRFRLLWFTALLTVVPGSAAETAAWGSAANGVRMATAINSGPHAEIRITVQNVDDKPLLLPFGSLIGSRFYETVSSAG